jgi:hypothetical protein
VLDFVGVSGIAFEPLAVMSLFQYRLLLLIITFVTVLLLNTFRGWPAHASDEEKRWQY